MKIFLIGFMGCGKSRKGKELAARLNYPFVDTDNEIVTATGMPVTDYFALHGQAAFRQIESNVLKTLADVPDMVIATGGGLPCFFDNMEWMNANGCTIYIKMEPAALVTRLHNRDKRPLIKGMNDTELLEFIHSKLAERETYYNQAHATVEGLNLDAAKILENLPAQ
ncbi:MAG: shikimate kinase [Sphingobacteriales bacterium]|nr:MAG: shikimate kinase [Sphingobacteriales bacterium]